MHSGRILYYQIFEGTMNSEKYYEILEDEFLPIAVAELGEDLVFQQDSATPHVEKNVKKLLNRYVPELLSWPSRSPDLNSLENVWGRVKQRVYSHNPANVEELQNCIEEEMNNIPNNYCENLIRSMDNRVAMLIEEEGSIIPY